MWELNASQFITPGTGIQKGHFPYTLKLVDFMTPADLADVQQYQNSQIYSLGMTFKIISCTNMYKYTNIGASTAQLFYTPVAGSNGWDFWVGFFNDQTQKNACIQLDADTILNRQKLLETGRYKRLNLNGRCVSFLWRQSTSYKGYFDDVPLDLTEAVDGGFTLPPGNKCEGIDFLWFDSSNYVNNAPNNTNATIRIQCTFHVGIVVRNRRALASV